MRRMVKVVRHSTYWPFNSAGAGNKLEGQISNEANLFEDDQQGLSDDDRTPGPGVGWWPRNHLFCLLFCSRCRVYFQAFPFIAQAGKLPYMTRAVLIYCY